MLTPLRRNITNRDTAMDNSIYVTLSRQLALFREMDVTAGNLANANTTGYSADHVLFNSYLTKDVNQGNANDLAFADDVATYRDLQGGPAVVTGNPLDVALKGNGFFMIQTPLGVRYTRAGNFQVDGDGQLITADGNLVLDNGGQPIVIPEEAQKIEIGGAGNIKVDDTELATFGVVRFENERVLRKLNGSLYASDADGIPADDGSVQVAQGMLEGANVQPVLEMTRMIDISRSVTNSAKFIEVIYDLQMKASNTFAKQA